MSEIRRLELSVLLSRNENIVDFTQRLTETTGIESVNTSLLHVDQRIFFVAITIEGHDIECDSLRETIRELGGVVHEFLEVSCGSYALESNDSYKIDLEWESIDRDHEFDL